MSRAHRCVRPWVLGAALGLPLLAAAEPVQWEAVVRMGGTLYNSEARAMGGAGGGVGVRATLDERFLLRADVAWLGLLGNVLETRLSAGVQLPGFYTPALQVTGSLLVGGGLHFLSVDRPTSGWGSAATVGLGLAPLRFSMEGMRVSMLELDVALGGDGAGTGWRYGLGLLEVGVVF
jgi:hypothetical protein